MRTSASRQRAAPSSDRRSIERSGHDDARPLDRVEPSPPMGHGLETTAHIWARAAHDLRQPVQAALLLVKVLGEEVDPVQQKRLLDYTATSLSSLYEMIEVLALLSRIEAGSQAVPLRSCHISAALDGTMKAMLKVASERGCPLQLRNMQGMVRSNAKLLGMVAKSLILNAMKLSEGKRISVGCRKQSNHLRFEVRFSGVRVDAWKGAFVQLPPAAGRPYVGELGLGPLLLQRVCERLGHRVYHRTLPRNGQLLAMELPLVSASM
jgi:two-component system, sensor histidine kinase